MSHAEQVGAVLVEDLGRVVEFEGGSVRVRPLMSGELLLGPVAGDVAAIGGCVIGSIEKLQGLFAAEGGEKGEEGMTPALIQELMAVLTPVFDPVRRVLQRCLDKPLDAIPHWALPEICMEFYRQNFAGPRLKSWAGLIRSAGAQMRATKTSSTLSTASSSSSSMGTPVGGATPPTSLSCTSGP